MPDADSATLVAILSNAIKTVSALNEQLGELRKVYTATKRLAAYADDSRQAFRRSGEARFRAARGDG